MKKNRGFILPKIITPRHDKSPEKTSTTRAKKYGVSMENLASCFSKTMTNKNAKKPSPRKYLDKFYNKITMDRLGRNELDTKMYSIPKTTRHSNYEDDQINDLKGIKTTDLDQKVKTQIKHKSKKSKLTENKFNFSLPKIKTTVIKKLGGQFNQYTGASIQKGFHDKDFANFVSTLSKKDHSKKRNLSVKIGNDN
jgi:hypothetical protein